MMRILEVRWRGGCCNRESDMKGRILAPPSAHAFEHRARVWLEDGAPCGAWIDDREPDPRWRRFVTSSIPRALWALAQTEGVEVEAKRAAA